MWVKEGKIPPMCCQRAGRLSQVPREGRGNASLRPAEGRSLPGTMEKGWGKPTSAQVAAEAQRNPSPSLKCSSGGLSALEVAKEPSAAPHRFPRGLVPRFEQHSIPEHLRAMLQTPQVLGKAAQQLQEGTRRPQPFRLICTSTNKRWKCLPSRAMNSCNRICA